MVQYSTTECVVESALYDEVLFENKVLVGILKPITK